jgi:transmembrane protein EpsG
MFFWIVIIIVIYVISFITYRHQSLQKVPWILLFVVSAFRYNVGTDYVNYYHLFLYKDGMFEYKEWGYTNLVNLLSGLGFNPQIMFFLFSLVTILLFYKSFKYFFKENDSLFMLATLLFIPLFYFYTLNGIRQSLAVAIFFYSIRFIIDKSYFKYFLLIVIAMLFHKSAIVLIPLYFFSTIKLTKYKLIVIYLVIVFLLLFNPLIYIVDIYVQNKLPLYFYFNDEFFSQGVSGFGKVIAIINVFLVLLLSFFLNKKNPLENIVFNLIIIFVVIKLFALDIQIIDRLSLYFKPIMILFVLLVIRNVNKLKNIFFISTLILTLSYTLVVIYIRANTDKSYNQYALNLYLYGDKDGVVQICGNATKVIFK